MNETLRLFVTVSLLALLGLGVAATGGATATGAGDYCEDVGANESVVFAGVGVDTASSDNRTVHADSTLTVGYCENSQPAERDWLDDGDGFDASDREGHTYEVRFTGDTETVDFGDHVDGDHSETAFDSLVITVADTDDDDELNGLYEQFQTDADETENATAALENATSELEGFDDIRDANETLRTLQGHHTNMTESRADLLRTLKSESESGNLTGAVGTAVQLDAEYSEYDGEVDRVTTEYEDTVTTAGEEPRSTVQLSVFGSLGAGIIVGLLAGAAVPLVAARRVKEKMKLSRDVNYDRKVALLPILAGIVFAVAGVAILTFLVDGGSLFQVIR